MPFGLKLRRIKEDKKKKNPYLQKGVKETPAEQADPPSPTPPDTHENVKEQNFDITQALFTKTTRARARTTDKADPGGGNSPLQPSQETPPNPEEPKEPTQEVPAVKPSSWGRSPRSTRNRSIRNLFTAPKLPFSNPFKRDPDRMQRVQTRWRIPGLLLFKRLIACMLLLINLGIGFATIPTVNGEMGLFFWVNAFILVDYLWKTRY